MDRWIRIAKESGLLGKLAPQTVLTCLAVCVLVWLFYITRINVDVLVLGTFVSVLVWKIQELEAQRKMELMELRMSYDADRLKMQEEYAEAMTHVKGAMVEQTKVWHALHSFLETQHQ